ncbi:hypothetical protein BCT21_11605 [Vibrio sp. 10N.222.55.F9]|uniref:hypothetical protein n=1 Tax=Vibrio sp. 10N.222.55.F9 TaxID=1884471 RepID=UPI000C863504|nr:hypothetical protein [Vibrio sp. 10N.222.55.F9]PMN99609.1 hypothetical protein BCT21_11605 [Vibrio sp. 10N.222.55.F9]
MRNTVFLVALATSFTSASVSASSNFNFLPAKSWENGSASHYFSFIDYDGYRAITLLVDHSKSGEQNFYIEHSVKNGSTCKAYSSRSTSVIKINGQAVKFLTFCNQFSDSKNWYQSMTPETTRGASFVVNTFKNAPKTVSVEAIDYTFNATAVGFTKAWNNAGGNAL